jgi:Cu+-exporting ATPase
MKRETAFVALAALVALVFVNNLWAQDPTLTRITFAEIHCAGCAKKIAKTLQAMPNVAQAGADFQTRTAVVKPKPQMVLSPRVLWEAMEKINQKPARLEGPSGTFTEKPKS